MSTTLHRPLDRTGWPVNAAGTGRRRPAVAVLGRADVPGLAAHLPAGWVVRRARGTADLAAHEIVLLTGADGARVAAARAELGRRAHLVALVAADAAAERVAEVLTAGADACVRDGRPVVLAGHLVAARRRQLADHWGALQSALAR